MEHNDDSIDLKSFTQVLDFIVEDSLNIKSKKIKWKDFLVRW